VIERNSRLPINRTLDKLLSLLEKWDVGEKNCVLVDEFAYVLQGYDVRGPEVKSGHLDLYVNPKVLPWKDKGERSIIPPKDSSYMDDWADFMQETKHGLDMLRAEPEILQIPTVNYKLPSGKTIRLMRAFEMTKAFVKQTIMHYSLEDVGEDKIREWIDKLELIKEAARKKENTRLVEYCQVQLIKAKDKWKEILV